MDGTGKNVMIVDGAINCAYDIFRMPEELFARVFCKQGQDIEFIEDFLARDGSGESDQLFEMMWQHPIAKKDVRGIDGILFYELLEKKPFYPNKRDSDLDGAVGQ